MVEVIIYTRQFCGYCEAAKGLFEKKQISFSERDGTFDASVRAEMMSKLGKTKDDNITFPQIFIGDKSIGGCDELFSLEQSKSLDSLLEQ